ncbi:MAG TPA: hypothetical protein VHO95_12925, partial [Candidatus Dormibacteraeota bacterium]|nr:hypothetical protein [Candidatus Dormibacteraeota bacterium]
MGAVSLLGTVPLLTALAQHGTTTTGEITEDFNQSVVQKPDRVIAADGFHQGDQGWYLDAGATGRFVYRIPGQPGTAIGVNLWVYSRGGVTNTVSVSAPGLPQLQVASNIESSGDRLAIPAQYARGTSLDVEIDATNSGPVEQLVVDQLVTYNVSGTDPRAPPAYSYVAFGLLIGVLTFLLLRRREKAHLVAIGVGATAAAAAASRITGLVLAHMPLDPDAVAYKIYGEQFQWWPLFDHGLFSGNFVEREPLYPMVLHLAFELFGESDFRMRVVSTTLSIAVVIVSVFAARRRLHTWWAPGLVGLGVASSGPLIAESYRGLRLELETLGVLALY